MKVSKASSYIATAGSFLRVCSNKDNAQHRYAGESILRISMSGTMVLTPCSNCPISASVSNTIVRYSPPAELQTEPWGCFSSQNNPTECPRATICVPVSRLPP